MPVISRFYGIVIIMYFNDHNPPHLHAKYSGDEALLTFDGDVLQGGLPGRAMKLVKEWALLHREELLNNWEKARLGMPLNEIAPLD